LNGIGQLTGWKERTNHFQKQAEMYQIWMQGPCGSRLQWAEFHQIW